MDDESNEIKGGLVEAEQREFADPEPGECAEKTDTADEQLLLRDVSDPIVSSKLFRLKPWIAPYLFGRKNVVLSPAFPAPVLTDATTVLTALSRNKRIKLPEDRITRLQHAFTKYNCIFGSTLRDLENAIKDWKIEAQTVHFNATEYYNDSRVAGYDKKLGRGEKSKQNNTIGSSRVPSGSGDKEKLLDADDEKAPSGSSGSVGSQAALARNCVWMLKKKSGLCIDFGCGSGLSSGEFHKPSFVVGVDASQAMLQRNRSQQIKIKLIIVFCIFVNWRRHLFRPQM